MNPADEYTCLLVETVCPQHVLGEGSGGQPRASANSVLSGGRRGRQGTVQWGGMGKRTAPQLPTLKVALHDPFLIFLVASAPAFGQQHCKVPALSYLLGCPSGMLQFLTRPQDGTGAPEVPPRVHTVPSALVPACPVSLLSYFTHHLPPPRCLLMWDLCTYHTIPSTPSIPSSLDGHSLS